MGVEFFEDQRQEMIAAIRAITEDVSADGLNYQFGYGATAANAPLVTKAPAMPDPDNINFHAQTTFIWQGFPAFRSPFAGAKVCLAGVKAARPGM